ncbi:MAG: rhomboid family intramembrane serine protease [Bacteroidetes bacterium]|nr:MAG: rhomboid family intramembrane serine protease [Bacteroidota bacterium]
MTEFRPGRFQVLPVIIKNLLIINGLCFLAQLTIDGLSAGRGFNVRTGVLADWFALHHLFSPLFKPWQLLTHMFMHGSLSHIFGNMFALWMFGSVLENLWGPKRFLSFYLICGFGAAVLHMGSLWYENAQLIADLTRLRDNVTIDNYELFYNHYLRNLLNYGEPYPSQLLNAWQADPGNFQYKEQGLALATSYANAALSGATMGASGAVFGCLAAFGYLFPNTYIYLYFFVPIKAKWVILGYMALELFLTFQNSAGDNVAHFAHLGGALVGFLLVYFWNRTNRRRFY